MAAAPSVGGGGLRRSATNVYRRLLNFDSPLLAMGLESVVPKGEEKLLKSSFYQAATMFILAFGAAGVYSLYLILSPFVKPILWAVLIGTVLHPLKLAVSYSVRNWLVGIGSSSSVPILSFHVIMSPLSVVFSLLSYIQLTVTRFLVPLVASSFIIICLCAIVRFDFPIISNYASISNSIFSFFGSVWFVVTLPWPLYLTTVIGYALAIAILPPSYWPSILLKICSFIWWILLFFLVSKLAGPLSLLLFPALLVPLCVKLISDYIKTRSKGKCQNVDNEPRPSLRSIKLASEFIFKLSPRLSNLAASNIRAAFAEHCDSRQKTVQKDEAHIKPANIIILAVLWAVILVKLLAHPLVIVALIPFILLPPVFRFIAGFESVASISSTILQLMRAWAESRRSGFLPPVVAKLGKYLVKGDAKIRKLLESCVEGCVTVLLIVGVVALFVFTIFFAAVQLHRETVYVFTMSNELLNQSLHPEVNRWLESADMNVTSLHDLASNAANFGREYFNSTLDGWIKSVPEVHREQLKLQLLNAYDLMSTKFFEIWSKDFGHVLHPTEIHVDLTDGADSSGIHSIVMEWFYFFRTNIASVMEISSSLWAVLKENAGLLFAIFTHVASALLLTSWTLLSYTVSSVVFLTSLYYLLIASGDTYKPVQLLISLTPFDDETTDGNIVGRAVDSGIRGVFYATFKMIIFYGLYTWFLHSLFDIGIAFLPSLCAAVFAAVPLVGAYWASLPGVFQLWLVADRGIAALLFFGLHMLPLYFFDALIYGDIKGGGHPYLTGLAIVGGVSCLGFEGAILGPVLLCLIVILMNLYRGVLHRPTASSTTATGAAVTESLPLAASGTGPTPNVRRTQSKPALSLDLVDSSSSVSSSCDNTDGSQLPQIDAKSGEQSKIED